jgi:poly-gamma-glutamate capsule biosynthesis protein CapA/YwtB (metallophosphatase superfamily)
LPYANHGAPRLNGVELYCGRPIFYDLGNPAFRTATWEGFYNDAVRQSDIAECRFVGSRFREMTLTQSN